MKHAVKAATTFQVKLTKSTSIIKLPRNTWRNRLAKTMRTSWHLLQSQVRTWAAQTQKSQSIQRLCWRCHRVSRRLDKNETSSSSSAPEEVCHKSPSRLKQQCCPSPYKEWTPPLPQCNSLTTLLLASNLGIENHRWRHRTTLYKRHAMPSQHGMQSLYHNGSFWRFSSQHTQPAGTASRKVPCPPSLPSAECVC